MAGKIHPRRPHRRIHKATDFSISYVVSHNGDLAGEGRFQKLAMV